MRTDAILFGMILTAALLGQDSKPAESSASRPATYDLRISTAPRALLVEFALTAKGKMNVKSGATQIVQTVDQKARGRWIDEVGDATAKTLVDRRTFLEAQGTDMGLVKDPGLEGVTLTFTTEGGKAGLVVEGTRRLLGTEMQAQLRQVGAVGLYTKLPQDVAVGGRAPFDGDSLLATLIGSSGPLSRLEGDLVLDRVEPAGQRAFLSGTIGFTEEVDKDGARFVAKYRVTLSLEVDLESHDVVRAALSGRAAVSGLGKLEGAVSGDVDVDSKATAKPATDVAAAKSRKPTFRENHHRMFGMEFKLPSCWLPDANTKDMKSFIDSRVEAGLGIEVALIEDKADPGSDDFVKAILEGLRKMDPKAKAQKAQFPIGKGLTFELSAEQGQTVRACVVPLGDVLVRARLVGLPDAVRKAESEFKAMQTSMRKAKP